jgi:glyoxylase-like metal-dependent hydrolase (beta-lactamase superfamily II)
VLANEGAYVDITGRRERELAIAVQEIGRNATGVRGMCRMPTISTAFLLRSKRRKADSIFSSRMRALPNTPPLETSLKSCTIQFSTSTSKGAVHSTEGTSADARRCIDSPSHRTPLVDAQLTKTNAERVLQEITKTQKPLSIIYITHEHADHFLGLEVFKEAYPKMRVIATSAVVERIAQVYQEKIAKWTQLLGSGATSHVVAIGPFDGPVITFENSQIAVLKNIQGDTNENTMLWIPGQRILIAGDVVFNNMHVYTAETDSKARGRWLNSLKTIRELDPSIVVPGHSRVGAPLDGSTAVDFTESYLSTFEKELTEARDPDGLINAMKKRFPSAELLLALERGAMANVEPDKKN